MQQSKPILFSLRKISFLLLAGHSFSSSSLSREFFSGEKPNLNDAEFRFTPSSFSSSLRAKFNYCRSLFFLKLNFNQSFAWIAEIELRKKRERAGKENLIKRERVKELAARRQFSASNCRNLTRESERMKVCRIASFEEN